MGEEGKGGGGAIQVNGPDSGTIPLAGAVNNNNNNNNTTTTTNHIERRNSRFFAISSLRCKPSPTGTLKWPGRSRVQITCNTLSAYHVKMLCYMPRCMKG